MLSRLPRLAEKSLGAWQDNNWDPAVGSTAFADFCDALGTPDNHTVKTSQGITVSNSTVKMANYVKQVAGLSCLFDENMNMAFQNIVPECPSNVSQDVV